MVEEYRQFILWAVAVGGIVYASLQIMGYVRMNAGRWGLFLAWLVAVSAAAASLPDAAPWKHRLIAASGVGIFFGLFLLILGRHAVKSVRERESTALGAPTAEEKGLEPNIVCEGVGDLFVVLDRRQTFREARHLQNALRATTVKFRNKTKPQQKVGSIDNVTARVLYYDFDFPEHLADEIDYPCWYDEESPSVSFGPDKVHHLIIGILVPNRDGRDGYEPGMRVYKNNSDSSVPLTSYALRYDRGFRIKVILIAGKHGEFGGEYDFELKDGALVYLTEEEKSARNASFARQLRMFAGEGAKFFVKPSEATDWDRFYEEAHEWRNRVSRFIREQRGRTESYRFIDSSNLKPYPHEVVEGRKKFLSELYTQYVNLQEMATEAAQGAVVNALTTQLTAPQAEGPQESTQTAGPNLISLRTLSLSSELGEDDIVRGEVNGSDARFIEFVNQRERGRRIGEVGHVKARITYQSPEDTFSIYYGHWLDERYAETDFSPGSHRRLLIAIENDKGLWALENHHESESRYYKTSGTLLKAEEYLVEVHLIGGAEGELEKDFYYTLRCKPELSLDECQEPSTPPSPVQDSDQKDGSTPSS